MTNRVERKERRISLDEAIQIALANTNAVRVLGGITAVGSGRTIYDPAIANTSVDQAHATFDPLVDGRHDFLRNESPNAIFDPGDPTRSLITGGRSDAYSTTTGITKRTVTGADAAIRVNANRNRQQPGIFPLNPSTTSDVTFSLSQPLLQGRGIAVNLSPIVVARIDTERSFFQLKDGLQSTVESVIQAYWQLVQARIDVWVRNQQIKLAEQTHRSAELNFQARRVNAATVAQAQLALANFRASLIAAEATLLDREAALRSMLGFTPSSTEELVPTSPPSNEKAEFDWDQVVLFAEEQRPDLIELKLVLEADEQLLLQTRNRARPQVDAVALYRWNGLEGEMPIGDRLRSNPGDFDDWQLGVNFSVPVGLRSSRAGLRRQQLIVARDHVNLHQAMLQVVHILAAQIRSLDAQFAQYEVLQETRAAADVNVRLQNAEFRAGRIEIINLLQAISDWGNAVSSVTFALIQYNTSLASLERETGSILEVHGVRLYEERYCSLGPLGELGKGRCYPRSMHPTENASRYPDTERPAEDFFNLQKQDTPRGDRPPRPGPLPGPRDVLGESTTADEEPGVRPESLDQN
ncbi:MAG: TolC family protein [Planctomycetales bacterium]|nr:TolC family protein [Planctomycetales bacterium]